MDAMMISQNWANRPADERFTSMDELHKYNVRKRQRSLEQGVALDHLRLVPHDGNGLTLERPDTGDSGDLSNWAFGQLCARAKAPAGYLRGLPSQLAAIPLQWSLEHVREDAKLLFRSNENNGGNSVDAVTSDSYGRIYDAEMTEAIIKHVDLGTWKIPSASYASKDPKRATTLYASDRDCFVALVDDQHAIEVPNVNGRDTLFRGFICRNSEVGAAAYDLFLFLYRYICDNRIIWGLQGDQHLKIRHTSGGPMRFMREARPALLNYLNASTRETVEVIQRAQDKSLGKSEADVTAWLRNRGFSQGFAKDIAAKASEEEGDARSLWNVVNAITAKAHDINYGDERLDLERKASKMLEAVAA
jgi:hypothetical protein